MPASFPPAGNDDNPSVHTGQSPTRAVEARYVSTLVEAVTYGLGGHSTADDPT